MRILAPWLLIIGVASWGFIRSSSQVRTLRMTRVYFAFCAIVSSIQLAFWFFWPGGYSDAYWIFEVAHSSLLCFLSVEIIWTLLPHFSAICWIAAASGIPLMTLHGKLPSQPAARLVMISTSASFIGGILLMSLFFMSVNWTREHRIATYGVVAILLGDLLSFFGISGHIGRNQISAVQLAPLLGLVLLCLAGRSRQADQPLGKADKLPKIASKPDLTADGVNPAKSAKFRAELKQPARQKSVESNCYADRTHTEGQMPVNFRQLESQGHTERNA